MRRGRTRIIDIVNNVLEKSPSVQTGEVATQAGITRQAAHRHLLRLTQEGVLRREGRGRGSKYVLSRKPGIERFSYTLEGLEEDRVWEEIRAKSVLLRDLDENVEGILYYAVTELVNNAIDHSGGSAVDLRLFPSSESVILEVTDDGEGIYRHLQNRLSLPDAYAAVQELSKGKVTTAPENHTGEGLFFVSKIADRFEIEGNGVCWHVDNLRGDFSVADVSPAAGTRARFEVSRSKTQTMKDLFDEYTEEFEFARTRIVVKLFEIGVRFVSRSEAKRLLSGLDRFREVVLDFSGVREIGQGFADEVFRVWLTAHPTTRITPVHATPAVEFMIKRAEKGS